MKSRKVLMIIIIIILIVLMAFLLYKKMTIKKVDFDSYSVMTKYFMPVGNISLQKITNENEFNELFNLIEKNHKEVYNENTRSELSELYSPVEEKKKLINKFNIDDEFWNKYFLVVYQKNSSQNIDMIEFDKTNNKLVLIKNEPILQKQKITDGIDGYDMVHFIKIDKKFEPTNNNIEFKIK